MNQTSLPSGLGTGAVMLERPGHAGREPGVEYWRVDRVARFLDCSKKRVYQLVQERHLQAIRLGPRQMRVLRRSLDEYIETLRLDAEDESWTNP